MEGFVASANTNAPCLGPEHEAWHASGPLPVGFSTLFKPLLDRFSGDMKATLGHLSTVHNETCGCQTGSSSHEATNRAWNQKKVPFMELQKLSGLDFEDYLNRVLRLLLTHSIRDVAPLSESEFWVTLRTSYPDNSSCNPDSMMEEDLADINNLIAKDIGGEPNQVFHSGPSQEEAFGGLVPSAAASNYSNLSNVDELLRLKRKEKHMAPIDCTGVSSAFSVTWKCKPCDRQHGCKSECDHYRLYHNPRHFIPNNPSDPSGLPRELQQRLDGIYTGEDGLKPYSRLGPLVGQFRKESDMDFDEDRSHIWLIYCDNADRKCVMTSNKEDSNWFRDVTPAESSMTANILAISMVDQLYLVTGPNGVPPYTKLKYFAKEDPTTEFWTSWTQAWANQKRCSRCSIHGQFDNVADYRVHISLWHDVSFQGNPQNRIYYCPDCCSKRIGAKEIVQHCKEAHDSLPFLCRHCSKRFETYNSLIKHKNRIHAVEKPLKKACERCGKVYLDPKALRQHVKQVHERSRQLHCVQCEFIFSSKYALNRHVREVHQKQQEFMCCHCNKQFTQQSNLKQHMLIHLGAKPYLCQHETCKAAFTTKQCLQVHYRKVHHYTDANMPQIQRVKLDHVVASRASNAATSDDSTHSLDFDRPSSYNSNINLQSNNAVQVQPPTFDSFKNV